MNKRVTTERILDFKEKYGESAAKELVDMVNDTRIELGYSDPRESESLAALINQGTKDIVEQKKNEK